MRPEQWKKRAIEKDGEQSRVEQSGAAQVQYKKKKEIRHNDSYRE